MMFGKYWLVVMVISFLCNCNAKAQIFEWAKSMSGYVLNNGISHDKAWNSYVTGDLLGSATFGSTQIMSSGSYDFFIVKYDANGNFQWVQKAGGKSADGGYGISTDATGDSYVTGYFCDTATFGSTQISSSGNYDIFIAKIDSSGNFRWVQKAGGKSDDRGYGISTDVAGNCYVTGVFRGTAKFDSTQIISSGSFGYYDIFIAKYDSSGNFLWVKKAGGTGFDRSFGISSDVNGNCYVIGYFEDTATFGSSQITSSGERDIFIAKYDANGNLKWVQKAGGTRHDYGFGITTDATGNCFVIGRFEDKATFDTVQIKSIGNYDIFIAKYDAAGNFKWVRKAGGTNLDEGKGVSTDTNGNCYVTGYFWGTATFGSTQITSSGMNDIFIAEYDANGNLKWVQNAGGTEWDEGNGITNDAEGNCYLTGSNYSNLTNFGSITLTSGTGFITKILTSATGIDNVAELPTEFSLAQNYPNPFNPSTVISYQIPVNSFVSLKVFDILGNEVSSLVNREQSPGSYDVTFEAGNLSSGVYLYQLRAGEFVSTRKLMLMK